jgi:hypothetical protein
MVAAALDGPLVIYTDCFARIGFNPFTTLVTLAGVFIFHWIYLSFVDLQVNDPILSNNGRLLPGGSDSVGY